MTATSGPALDLDISAFRATKRDSVSGGQPIKLRLVVKNNGTVEGVALANIVGVQGGVQVYDQVMSVTDAVGNGRTTFDFPTFEPTVMAMRLSPHDPMLWSMQAIMSACCHSLENYDEAVEWARKSVNARPDLLWAHIMLAAALAGQDRLDEARVAIDAARRVKPDLSLSVIGRLLPHYHNLDRLIDALRKVGLPE